MMDNVNLEYNDDPEGRYWRPPVRNPEKTLALLKPGNINWKELSDAHDKATKMMWEKCPAVKKNFYIEDEEVRDYDEEDVERFRSDYNIVVSRVFAAKKGNKAIPNPVQTHFGAFRHFAGIMRNIIDNNLALPTPLQCQAWPVLLGGDDLIGIAQNGSGKTLAYLLPAFVHIKGQQIAEQARNGPKVLILVPTREYGVDIVKEVRKYPYNRIKAYCICDGGDRSEQVSTVAKGVQILVGTPICLYNYIYKGYINLNSVTYTVMHNADIMLEMDMQQYIRKILLYVHPDRQTVLTSTTWTSDVRRLAESYMDNPVKVHVDSPNSAAVPTVTQEIIYLGDDENEKFRRLTNLALAMTPTDKMIVFCGKKARADNVAAELAMIGVDCLSIHGYRNRWDREKSLVDVASGKVHILITTDVGSRGIDIQGITHVINYDFPRHIDDYIYRVRRSQRPNNNIVSIIYLNRSDCSNTKHVMLILQKADQYMNQPLHMA